jgi:hypothetical protein
MITDWYGFGRKKEHGLLSGTIMASVWRDLWKTLKTKSR